MTGGFPQSFLYFLSDLTDSLRHSSHRTEGAPGPWFVQRHNNQSNDGGSQHQTIKSKTELCDPVSNSSCRIGPTPWNLNCPEKFDYFFQRSGSCCYQISLKYYISKHNQKENKESITKSFGCHHRALSGYCFKFLPYLRSTSR